MDLAYGVPVAQATPTLAQGRVGNLDPDYEPGFRIGAFRQFDENSTIGLTYTQLETESNSDLITAPGQIIQPLVTSPTLFLPTWVGAAARQDIDLRLLDADWRYVFSQGPRNEMAVVAGLRYANLEQNFSSVFLSANPAAGPNEFVFSDISFHGAGIRLGLEMERRAANSGIFLYGKGYSNFVAGKFNASFVEATEVEGTTTPFIDTGWKATRLVSMLDLELGIGWVSDSGRLRLSSGYTVSGWYNTITTQDWVNAVRTNNMSNLSDNLLTFDGFVFRSELRF
jgi:hypothetical protein